MLMDLTNPGCVCRWNGDCITNNNGDTGFVTALIFSVVTEQTIGLFAPTILTLSLLHQAAVCINSAQCLLQVMETHTQISAGLLLG